MLILDKLRLLGQVGLELLMSLGRSGLFLTQLLIRKPQFKRSFPLLIEQLYFIGVLSLVIIALSGLFMPKDKQMQDINAPQSPAGFDLRTLTPEQLKKLIEQLSFQ